MLLVHAPACRSVCRLTVFPESLAGFIRVLGRHRAGGSDMTPTSRGMRRTRVWLTSSPTRRCTGHTVSDTETLELPKRQYAQPFVCSAGICLCLWAPLWKCLAAGPPLCCARVRMSSVSTEGSCRAESSGTFMVTVPRERTEGIER